MKSSGVHMERVAFLGLTFDLLEIEEAVRTVLALGTAGPFSFVVTPNVDHMVRLHRQRDDRRLWRIYESAALRLCDSRILQRLARLSRLELSLVAGSDLTAQLLRSPNHLQNVAVVGGDENLMGGLSALYPSISWYHHAPPQGVLHNAKAQMDVIEFVEDCGANLTFMAIGSPQSELICEQLYQRNTARGVALCVGASLEFLTGAKRRAPVLLQRAGLEWLFRLATEPRRLWRRYLVEGPAIFRIWWQWRPSSPR